MKTAAEIMELIDVTTEPQFMTKEQALSFLEDIREEVLSRMEALRDEPRST